MNARSISIAISLVFAAPIVAQDDFLDLAKRGLAELRAKRYVAAVDLLERANSMRPDEEAVAHGLAAALTHIGGADHAAGDLRAAIDRFERANSLWPNQVNILASLGQIRFDLGEVRAALPHFEAVIALEPNHAHALAGLGHIAVRLDREEEAADYFRRASEAAPDHQGYRQLAAKFGKHASVESGFRSLRHGIFELQYPAGRAAGVQKVLPTIRTWLNGALRDLRRDLGRMPKQPIKIVLYAEGQFRAVSTAQHWAKAYFDGKVRLDLGAWETNRDGVRDDLRHELAHAFLHTFYPGLPAWIHEGYAQLIEGRGLSVARSVCRAGLLERRLWVDGFVSSDDVNVVRRGYAQSLLAVAHLRGLRSTREFTRVLQKISGGMSSEAAVQNVYRLELDALFAQALAAKPSIPAARPSR